MKKYSIRLDRMCHRVTIILEIFPRGFTDHANVLLPHKRTLSKPISLGLVVLYVTPEITRARAHLKSVTRDEHFYGLDILCMKDQYAFGSFRMISVPWPLAC